MLFVHRIACREVCDSLGRHKRFACKKSWYSENTGKIKGQHAFHNMTHMHDEGFGFDFGQEHDVGKDVCPGRPSVHVGTEASHACTHSHTHT